MTDQTTTPAGPDLEAALDSIRKAWKPIHDAAAGLWRGPLGQALRRREAILRARREHRADGYRDPYVEEFPPSGCGRVRCGVAELEHYPSRLRELGVRVPAHFLYQQPTDRQVLTRMRSRRADRLNRSTTR